MKRVLPGLALGVLAAAVVASWVLAVVTTLMGGIQ